MSRGKSISGQIRSSKVFTSNHIIITSSSHHLTSHNSSSHFSHLTSHISSYHSPSFQLLFSKRSERHDKVGVKIRLKQVNNSRNSEHHVSSFKANKNAAGESLDMRKFQVLITNKQSSLTHSLAHSLTLLLTHSPTIRSVRLFTVLRRGKGYYSTTNSSTISLLTHLLLQC